MAWTTNTNSFAQLQGKRASRWNQLKLLINWVCRSGESLHLRSHVSKRAFGNRDLLINLHRDSTMEDDLLAGMILTSIDLIFGSHYESFAPPRHYCQEKVLLPRIKFGIIGYSWHVGEAWAHHQYTWIQHIRVEVGSLFIDLLGIGVIEDINMYIQHADQVVHK